LAVAGIAAISIEPGYGEHYLCTAAETHATNLLDGQRWLDDRQPRKAPDGVGS